LIEDFQKYLDLVETTVDLAQLDNHEFVIKPEFDEALQGRGVVLMCGTTQL
jgi:DNA mismatch repair protein MSH2